MTLADVLAAKGRGVVTLWTTRRLEDAIRLFDDHHIAAVVIVDPSDARWASSPSGKPFTPSPATARAP